MPESWGQSHHTRIENDYKMFFVRNWQDWLTRSDKGMDVYTPAVITEEKCIHYSSIGANMKHCGVYILYIVYIYISFISMCRGMQVCLYCYTGVCVALMADVHPPCFSINSTT